ncbi:hypothetical protein BG004_003674 [Podila humilis]|nr:hypothetical protein BG004_003674 [Podila humilis]
MNAIQSPEYYHPAVTAFVELKETLRIKPLTFEYVRPMSRKRIANMLAFLYSNKHCDDTFQKVYLSPSG